MSKKKTVEVMDEDFFDFDEASFDEDYDQDSLFDVMHGVLDANNKQMTIAVELTKLIVANKPVDNMEEHVFSVFKKAIKVVEESSALKHIMEKMEQ